MKLNGNTSDANGGNISQQNNRVAEDMVGVGEYMINSYESSDDVPLTEVPCTVKQERISIEEESMLEQDEFSDETSTGVAYPVPQNNGKPMESTYNGLLTNGTDGYDIRLGRTTLPATQHQDVRVFDEPADTEQPWGEITAVRLENVSEQIKMMFQHDVRMSKRIALLEEQNSRIEQQVSRIVEQNTRIEQQNKRIEKNLADIAAQISLIMDRPQPKETTTRARYVGPFFEPTENERQLDELERKLDDASFRSEMITWLNQNVSGVGADDRMVATMDLLLTKQFQTQCTWTGASKKGPKTAIMTKHNILALFRMIGGNINERKLARFFMRELKKVKKRVSVNHVRNGRPPTIEKSSYRMSPLGINAGRLKPSRINFYSDESSDESQNILIQFSDSE